MDLIKTIKGSLLENFFPEGWDLKRIDRCCSNPPEKILERQKWWHEEFQPVMCETLEEFDTKMGHEIAREIADTAGKEENLFLSFLSDRWVCINGLFIFLRSGIFPANMFMALTWMNGAMQKEIPFHQPIPVHFRTQWNRLFMGH